MSGYDFDVMAVGDEGVIMELYRPGRAQGRIFIDHVIPTAGGAGDLLSISSLRAATIAGQDAAGLLGEGEVWTLQCGVLPVDSDTIRIVIDDAFVPSVDAQLGRRSVPANGIVFEFLDPPPSPPAVNTDVRVNIGATIAASMQNLYEAILQRHVEQNLPVEVTYDGVDTITVRNLVVGNVVMIVESTGGVRFTPTQAQAGNDPPDATDLIAQLPLDGREDIEVGLMLTEGCFLQCDEDASCEVYYRYHGQTARLSGYAGGSEGPFTV